MQTDMSRLTDKELSALIMAAMEEWASRQPEAQQAPIRRQTAAPRMVPQPREVPVNEPPQPSKEVVLGIKTRLLHGKLITAAERAAVSTIAEKFPEWVLRQGLPTVKSNREWREAADRLYRYPPAKEC